MTDTKMFIESEGGLFRGYSPSHPTEIWHPGSGWEPYTGGTKPQHWGDKITADQANQMMVDLTKEDADYKASKAKRPQAAE